MSKPGVVLPVIVVPVVVLVAAVTLCAVILLYGPDLAEKLRSQLSDSQAANMPLVETLFTGLIFGALLVTAAVGAWLSGGNAFALGRHPGQMLLIGLLTGLFGVAVATVYAGVAGTLGGGASGVVGAGLLIWGLLLVVVQAGAEEVYFRGWLQPALQRRWGAIAAILVTASAFALLHYAGGTRAPVSLLNLFLGGVMFGVFAVRGGGIAGALGLHVGWNATEEIAVGLTPNPGVGSFGALFDYDLVGAALWGGTEEGLNASIAMTVVMLAIVVPMIILSRRALFGDRFTVPASPGSGRSGPART